MVDVGPDRRHLLVHDAPEEAGEGPVDDPRQDVCLAVARAPFAIDDDRHLVVTVSIGCVTAPATSWEAAVQAADVAMYEAKAGGRNGWRPGALDA